MQVNARRIAPFWSLCALAALSWTGIGLSQQFDSTPTWPLCGRISEAPPQNWIDSDGCPAERWGNVNFTDWPIASPFGPRPLASENDRYDFHRGIDIAAAEGTPVFAIADGVVRIAGDHSSYSDPLVQLRHFRPGQTSCDNVGCYHSNYMHLTQAVVAVDAAVNKGDLIGYTGSSASGFAHLHFEIRDAPGFDKFSSWQRDCVHPLQVLPYQSAATPTVVFDSVNTGDPNSPVVELTVNTPRIDIERIELEVRDGSGNAIPQPGNTPDARSYNVNPSWFGMDDWNFQYTHKNSSAVPWASFAAGGENQCPYHLNHGTSYDPHIHMDRQLPSDPLVGEFNGVEIRPTKYVEGDYTLNLVFKALQGPAVCLVATVHQATGGTSSTEWGNCSGQPGSSTDYTVTSELLTGGTQQGSYPNTWVQNDGVAEVLTERQSGGKPKNRYSFLDHDWNIDIGPGGSVVALWVDAFASVSSDGDQFELTVSGSSQVLTIDKTTDTDAYQTLTLPGGINGTVVVTLRDTDQSRGAKSLDSVTVDHLFIRVEDATNLDPPETPVNASATALSASSAEVVWSHAGDTESGFKVERQARNTDLTWGPWAEAGTAGANATSFVDTDLLSQATYRYRVAATNAAGDSAWAESGEVMTPAGSAITAGANGYKRKGWQYVDVSWSGAPAGSIDIWRDAVAVALGVPAGAAGSGAYTDSRIAKGGATYSYQVCVSGDPANCSDPVVVVF
jgi:murein DD-endopeptidase MepM/ murein hydrolase activator NlpD